jgi:hypothetical protein
MSKITGTADYERGSRMAQGQTATGVQNIKDYTGQAVGQVSPYQKVGTEALDLYRDIVLGGDMSKFFESPGYQFRLGEGLKALEGRGSAMGITQSGAQQKAIQDYAQGLASQEYGNVLGRIGGLAGQGLQAGQLAGGYLSGAGSNIGQMYGQLGQTQAGMMAGKGALKGKLWGDVMRMMSSGGGEGGGAQQAGQIVAGSDERIKQNIVRTGIKKNGIEIVEFNYNDKSGKDTSKRYRGVIAQEVEKIKPEAVSEKDGFKHVDYSMIEIEMEEI